MKILCLIIVALFSMSSFAGVGGSVGGSSGSGGSRSGRLSSIFDGKRLVTLEDFEASKSHIVHWPVVKFAQLVVPLSNVCLDGVALKTIKQIKVCTEEAPVEVCTVSSSFGTDICRKIKKNEKIDSRNSRIVRGCVKEEEKSLETSKFFEIDECTSWIRNNESRENSQFKCLESTIVTKEYDDDYVIQVSKSGSERSGNSHIVKEINFTIPQCND